MMVLYYFLFGIGSPIGLDLTGSLSLSPPPHWDNKCVPPLWTLLCGPGDWTQLLVLPGKHAKWPLQPRAAQHPLRTCHIPTVWSGLGTPRPAAPRLPAAVCTFAGACKHPEGMRKARCGNVRGSPGLGLRASSHARGGHLYCRMGHPPS